MACALSADTVFRVLYCTTIVVSLLLTRPKLERFFRYMPLSCRFGHWYYPRSCAYQSSVCGVLPMPQLSLVQLRGTFVLLCVCTLACPLSDLFTHEQSITFTIEAAAQESIATNIVQSLPTVLSFTSALSHQQWAGFAFVLSLLYFGQVRSHGLVHNKADLVPWSLFILALAPTQHKTAAATTIETNANCSAPMLTAPPIGIAGPVFCVQLLVALAYCSSGLTKLRKSGLYWAHGRNLSRLLARFCLEYGMVKSYDTAIRDRKLYHIGEISQITGSLIRFAPSCMKWMYRESPKCIGE